jgi:hypothetical protein
MIKLNLGCGSKILQGYINIDKFDSYNPDIVHDLEKFPYPFKDNSVNEILLSHVLEHLGQSPDTFNNIIKELYRICLNGSKINIIVPHPRHDDFLSDPTHVRPITVFGLTLYDQELNKEWEKKGNANTPMGIIHNVNFKVIDVNMVLDEKYESLIKIGKIKHEEIKDIISKYNNVVKEMRIIWEVIK